MWTHSASEGELHMTKDYFSFQGLEIGLQICCSPNQIAGWSLPTLHNTFRVMGDFLFSSLLGKQEGRKVHLMGSFFSWLLVTSCLSCEKE